MKTPKRNILATAISSILLVSCAGNSIESDAKKVAELQCKSQQLLARVTSGDLNVMEESNQLTAEAEAIYKEMEGKYASQADQKKFVEALVKEMGNCK